MHRTAFHVSLVLALIVSTVVGALGAARTEAVGAAPAQPGGAGWTDQDLFGALDSSGLLGAWTESSTTQPQLDFVSVTGRGYDNARQALIDLLDEEQAAASTWASTAANTSYNERELRLLLEDEERAEEFIAAIDASIQDFADQRKVTLGAIDKAGETRQEIAIARYMGGRLAAELQAVKGEKSVDREFDRSTILAATDQSYIDHVADLRGNVAALEDAIAGEFRSRERTIEILQETSSRKVATNDELAQLRLELTGFESNTAVLHEEARAMIPALQQLRSTATIPSMGFSLVAYDAYLAAAETMVDAPNECALDWATLAAIGDIESNHGTLGGRYVAANGSLSRSLLGVLLDGDDDGDVTIDGAGSTFRSVPDSDNGELDGSTSFDRALGPMQFLPSTWRAHGRDGNGDGVNDPQNIYDAAVGAANYLCVVVDEVGSGELSDRLRAYNDSKSYVDEVISTSKRLRALTEDPDD